MRFYLLGIVCFAVPAVTQAKICNEVPYQYRSLPRGVGLTQPVAGLLNQDEEETPGAMRALALQPGPYGHSELGFRYLARLFGYPGEFDGKKETVERWLMEEEIKKNDLNRGLRDRWTRWVVNAPRRLSVPLGPVSRIPDDARAEVLFRDLYEQDELNRCVAMDLATLRCENSQGKSLRPGHVVYYGSAESPDTKKYCRAYWHGSLAEEAPANETITETSSTTMGGQITKVTTTTTREWKRANNTESNSSQSSEKAEGPSGSVKSAK